MSQNCFDVTSSTGLGTHQTEPIAPGHRRRFVASCRWKGSRRPFGKLDFFIFFPFSESLIADVTDGKWLVSSIHFFMLCTVSNLDLPSSPVSPSSRFTIIVEVLYVVPLPTSKQHTSLYFHPQGSICSFIAIDRAIETFSSPSSRCYMLFHRRSQSSIRYVISIIRAVYVVPLPSSGRYMSFCCHHQGGISRSIAVVKALYAVSSPFLRQVELFHCHLHGGVRRYMAIVMAVYVVPIPLSERYTSIIFLGC